MGLLTADFAATYMSDTSDQIKEAFWHALGLPPDILITVRHIVSIPFSRAEADLNRASVLEPNPDGGGAVRTPVSAFMAGQLLDPIRAAFTDLDRVSAPPTAAPP